MAKTVNEAFNEFNRDSVNLIPDRTTAARSSRDWLIGQLLSLPNKVDDFPKIYDNMSVKYGSFARNTKISPLDDIDLILAFSAEGSTYSTITYGKKYKLYVPETATILRKLCNDDNSLNSIKLVNKLVSSLDKIEQYKSAKKHRRQEAATLNLSSYEWVFDIVPAFYTDKQYYLIPDGLGEWKATNPKIDQDRTTSINQNYDSRVLQLIRIIKYWNKTAFMTTIPSYLLENIILNFVESQENLEVWIDSNLINFWNYLKTNIYNSVNDPKGFQGELNTLTWDEKVNIATKAQAAHTKSLEANRFELNDKDQEKAIKKWIEIFGDKFPKYE